MNAGRARNVGLGLFIGGAALFAFAAWGLWRDIAWIAQPFYAYAWWSYIFMMDGFAALRRGSSLLTTRRRYLLPMCIWSVTFWCFFELLNVRFQNWYYVGVFPCRSAIDLLGGGLFVFLCFSTVFVGIFTTYEALTAVGLGRSWQARPRQFPRWTSYAVQGLGAVMAGLAILFPYYLAPLIWGSFTFLVDPWNYRRGARSLLCDLEHGDWGLVARVFLAGLVCGFVWESFNFFAPQKWIYTVRGLENFKLFEMPLLGFLGFPALALDSFAAFALISSVLLGNETWEHPGDLRYRVPTYSRRPSGVWRSAPLQVFFWAVVAVQATRVNLGSLRIDLDDLGLSAPEAAVLEREDVERPRQLLRVTRNPERRNSLKTALGWDETRMQRLLTHAELLTFKGIGSEFGSLLTSVGVHCVDDLVAWDPVHLHARLEEVAGDVPVSRIPRLDMVRVWVLAGRDRGIILSTP